MTLSTEDGDYAVSLARKALDAHVGGKGRLPVPRTDGPFGEARGVFVTLNLTKQAEERLRGCIGFPYPVAPLGTAIVEAAVAASTEDPRFPPVSPGELEQILVEVSVLTTPSPLSSPSPEGRASLVRIGVDGLIVSRGRLSGLLLPQVATEFGLSEEDFLTQGCLKAGLPPAAWLDPETSVSVFQAEIFAESAPRGASSRTGGNKTPA